MLSIKPQVPLINWGSPLSKGLIFNTALFKRSVAADFDLSPSHLPIAFTGSPAPVSGLVGYGVKFDGSTTFGKTATVATSATNNITLEVLASMSVLQSESFLYNGTVNNAAGTNTGYGIRRSNSQTKFQFDAPNSGTTITGSLVPVIGVVYHIVGTIDSTGAGKLYVNGLLDGTGNMTITTPTTGVSLGAQIGSDGVQGDFLNGIIYKASIYNRLLTATEVKQLFINPWQIYRKPSFNSYYVSPAVAAGSSIKTINGLAKASVKTVTGLAIASVKTWQGLA